MVKNTKAITLISLVITIVVLIILAGIGINLSLGNNGIFTRAKQAREATNKQTATEKINLKITTAQMNKYAEKQVMPTLKELSEVLRYDYEIQYVTEESQVASAKYDVPSENPSSIFTKLNEYPYEFEINGQLQLASIDGIKIAVGQDNGNVNSGKLFDYSSNNEKIIGTWYNGKIMYEISIPITIPTTTTEGKLSTNSIDLSAYNIDDCFVYDGYFKTSEYCVTLPLYTQQNGNIISLLYYNKEQALHINNETTTYSGGTGYVTLHYTKKDISE